MMKKTNKKSILAIVFAAIFVFTSITGIFLPQQASAIGKRGKIRSVRVTSVKNLTVGKTSRIKVKVNPKKVAAKVTYIRKGIAMNVGGALYCCIGKNLF